jgi:ubiquinone/menaquinone biosynthesis C-methylase UbiE
MINSIKLHLQKISYLTDEIEYSEIRKILDTFENKSDILDVGSGLADFADFTFKAYPKIKITCVDINESLVKLAIKKGYRGQVAEITKLPFETEQFDVVHCSHVIEHLAYPAIVRALDEMLRVTKKGGVLILRSPLILNHRFYNDIDHIRPYPPAAILNYFNYEKQQKRSDYSVIEIHRWYTRIYFELDQNRYTGKFAKYLNLIFKLSWSALRFPSARPNNYGLVLKKVD